MHTTYTISLSQIDHTTHTSLLECDKCVEVFLVNGQQEERYEGDGKAYVDHDKHDDTPPAFLLAVDQLRKL